MSLILRVALALAAGLLAGCAATVNERYATGDPARTGLVIIGYGESGFYRDFMNPDVHFKNADGSLTGSVAIPTGLYRYLKTGERIPIPISPSLVVTPEDPAGGVHLLRLPEGRYAFFRYGGVSVSGGTMVSVTRSISGPVSNAEFVVKAGVLSYAGRVTVNYNAPGRVTLINQAADDLAAFRREFPQYKDAKIELPRPPEADDGLGGLLDKNQ